MLSSMLGSGAQDSDTASGVNMAADALAQKQERDEMDAKFRANGMVDRLRTELGDLAKHPYIGSGDECLLRFLRADGGNFNASLTRLKTTLQWRDETDPVALKCTACLKDPKSHYMHHVGWDKFGRPVIYSCIGLAKDRTNIETNMEHIVQTLEKMVAEMGPGVETYVWLCDFHGFGISDCDPRMGAASNNLFSRHYPERMGHFLFLDAPRIFSTVYRAMKLIVDKRTVRKLRFVDGPKKKGGAPLRAALAELFDQELVDWVVTEMLENRDPKKAQTKSWGSADEADSIPLPLPLSMGGIANGSFSSPTPTTAQIGALHHPQQLSGNSNAIAVDDTTGGAHQFDVPAGHDLRGPPSRIRTLLRAKRARGLSITSKLET